MVLDLRIKIKKRSQVGWLMWLLIIMPFTFWVLLDLLHLPNLIKYAMDAAWLLLLVYMLRFNKCVSGKRLVPLILWVLIFFVYTLISYIPRYQSALYYLWGARNNFRFYIAMFAFSLFMDQTDGSLYLKLLDKLFWIEFWVCMIQYFILGYHGDFLGGLFGVVTGTNGFLNILFIIITAKSVLMFLNKTESIYSCLRKCGAALLVSVLAELKFFFVEFSVIVVIATIITDFSWRKLTLTLASIVGVSVGILLLGELYPFFKDIFSIEGLLELATSDIGYTFRGDLNRLTVIPQIDSRFLTTPIDRLTGLGLGNCDSSGFDFLTTPFYKAYGWTHYQWFSTSFVYMEMGWIGLIMFFGFFLLHYLCVTKIQRKGQGVVLHCQLARVVSLCCILVAIYNSSLRMEAGYMAYFVLALPFMQQRRKRKGG